MTIEEELFKKTRVDFEKIIKYGFKKENSLYKYSKNIMNNTFRIDVEINDAIKEMCGDEPQFEWEKFP